MSGRNILQKVGAAPDLKNKPEESDSEEENSDKNSLNMNMKQESGPFLMPQLWKDNINLDNLTNDFLESNVTGEVMNLDDFLKELQVNELAQQTEEIQRQMMSPPAPHQQHFQRQHQQQQQQQSDNRFQNNLRPANIDSLKDPSQTPPSRPSIMHQVGKPPDLGMNKFGPGDPGEGGLQLPPHVNLPYRDRETGASSALSPQQHNLFNSHNKDGHGGVPGQPQQHHQGGIPQASVRPLVRPVIMSSETKHEPGADIPDIKPPAQKRKRKVSDCSNFTDDDEDGGIGSFTSTVCVNFSEDDLRLATIPGQDFDPATRRFSEEELKPQPIIRKRKKQFVPDELKNNKYWAKRYKNNEAAKRSREARRLKENQIAMRARYLEEENSALKSEVDVLKKENSDLKQMMIALEEKMNQMSNNR